jgi:hypothetical protein
MNQMEITYIGGGIPYGGTKGNGGKGIPEIKTIESF